MFFGLLFEKFVVVAVWALVFVALISFVTAAAQFGLVMAAFQMHPAAAVRHTL